VSCFAQMVSWRPVNALTGGFDRQREEESEMVQDLVDDQTEEVGSQLDGDHRRDQAVDHVTGNPQGCWLAAPQDRHDGAA
jgi:hypothetical protein